MILPLGVIVSNIVFPRLLVLPNKAWMALRTAIAVL